MAEFTITFADKLHSKWNRLCFSVRNLLAFTRTGYREVGVNPEELKKWQNSFPADTQKQIETLIQKYNFVPQQKFLKLETFQKNLATLWLLDLILNVGSPWEKYCPLPAGLNVLEAGAHDFSRAPAISAFFETQKTKNKLIGLELDAYKILSDFHSRFDRAQYYAAQVKNSQFLVQNFFTWKEPVDVLFAFYPFVSPHPAISWGLPMELGSAGAWVEALIRSVKPDGFALVVHQGEWEEQEFDNAMPFGAFRLQILQRKTLNCPFYPLPHPAQATLYQLVLT